jgi:hypothetical protein
MESPKAPQGKSIARMIGTVIALAGVAALAYGGVAFWLMRSLPPNTVESRLPSIYVMGAGIVVALAGLALPDFRWK